MKKSVIFLGLIMAALIVMTYFSWKQLHFQSGSHVEINLALDNAIESLDPAKSYSDDSLVISSQVLEPLYQYHYLKRPYEIQPLVAEGLPQVSEKGKKLTIKIRKDIYFHDHPAFLGKKRELTAEDFVTQFKRLSMDGLKSPGKSLFLGVVQGFDEYGKEIKDDWTQIEQHPMKGVEAVDKWTLVIHLNRPEPNMVYYLALNFLAPVPWELVKYTKNNFDHILLGTGPYVYKGFIENRYFELVKFKDYRLDFYPTAGDRYANVQKLLDSSKQKIPFIDSVKFFVTKSEEERWNMFLNREIDLLTVPKIFIPNLYDEKGELHEELKSKEIKLKHFPILANRWLAFNMRDPLVGKNAHLRRAIAYSIDYSQYLQVISQNTNLRANSILVPGISGYMPTNDFRLKYDLGLAREYLKLAGFDRPDKMPTIKYSTRGNQAINLLEADFVKKSLEAIGLKVEIQVLTFSEFLQKGRAGELMFFTDNWLFDYPDGENILQLLVSTNFPGINKSGYSNPRVDELYLQLKETTNIDQRDKIFYEIQDIAFEDLPWIPLMYESSFVLQYPDIKNFRKSSIIRNYVKYLKIER